MGHTRAIELIAHRAGNLAATLPAALAVADAIELDVHLFRGRIEVRHSKVLWPTAARWERWHLEPKSTERPDLEEILTLVPPGTHVWIDLKGFDRRLTRRVLSAVGDDVSLTVSARAWWTLAPARDRPGTRVMRSVGNRWQRWIVERFGSGGDGVVLHERLLTPTAVGRLRSIAPHVVAWAVTNRTRLQELESMGIDGAIVDDVELIRSSRNNA